MEYNCVLFEQLIAHIHLILDLHDFKYCQSACEQDNSEISAIQMYLSIYLSNTTVVAHINKQGETHLVELWALMWRFLTWCNKHQITLSKTCPGLPQCHYGWPLQEKPTTPSPNSTSTQSGPEIYVPNCRLILIAPGWPTRPWFWDLVEMSLNYPRQLPPICPLLKQPLNNRFHTPPESLNLHVWYLGVQSSRIRVSLQKWQIELLHLKDSLLEP